MLGRFAMKKRKLSNLTGFPVFFPGWGASPLLQVMDPAQAKLEIGGFTQGAEDGFFALQEYKFGISFFGLFLHLNSNKR